MAALGDRIDTWRQRRRDSRATGAPPVSPPETDLVTFEVPGISVLPSPARTEFETHLRDFGEDLFTEAGRIEADYRETEIPQFTDTMIRDAARSTRRIRVLTEKLSVGAIVMNGVGGLLIAAGGITVSFASARSDDGTELFVLGLPPGGWVGVTVAAYIIGAGVVITSFFLPRKASR